MRKSLSMSHGDPIIFVTRPLALGVLLLCLLSMAGAISMRRRESKVLAVGLQGNLDQQ